MRDENERTIDCRLKGKKPGTEQGRDVTQLPVYRTPASAWTHVLLSRFKDTDTKTEITLQGCQNEAPDRGRDKNHV